MTIDELACRLEVWRGRREALDEVLNLLDAATGGTPESPLRDAINEIWMGYTCAQAQLIGDKGEWLFWYCEERAMGHRPGDVFPAEGAAKITVTRDLRTLASVILWGRE
jgi:hypothetical protein